ncbi:Metallo-dependent phosphatase-like protein [Pisolithus croceorrhizus]|nr:Metallo-dependent phosphatase-like protein [Pisolithus croceorrhizus]
MLSTRLSTLRLPSRPLAVNGLRILWVLVVLWHELRAFDWALQSCLWPDSEQLQAQLPNSRVARILVIADPQVLDEHSYPERGAFMSFLTQLMVDLNLRKSWRAAFHHLQPDAVVVLGDMMDNGRKSMSTTEYENYHQRYRDIFKAYKRPVPTYYLPGNHDVGLGASASFSLEADSRYTSHFGPRNHYTSVGNHTLVFIDATALAEEDVLRAGRGHSFDSWPAVRYGPIEFVKQIAASHSGGSFVLFTHIPLARPQNASCGPLRERGTIRQGFGFGYQNTLMEGATVFLLDRLKPSLILSGDDHDYCDYQHIIPSTNTSVREVTVKSFSIAMGVRRPGFQLLSLISTVPLDDSLNQVPVLPPLDTPCFLPDQIGIYLQVYLPLTVLSLAFLLLCNVLWSTQRVRGTKRDRSRTRMSYHGFSRGVGGHRRSRSADAHYEMDHPSSLPLPISKPRNVDFGFAWWKGRWWTSVFCRCKRGIQRRRIPSLPHRSSYRHEVGVLCAFTKDALNVAWPAASVFVVAAWWAMQR